MGGLGDGRGLTVYHLPVDTLGLTRTHIWYRLVSLRFNVALRFTWSHFVSLGFTWFHSVSLGFTRFHLVSEWFHMAPFGLTWIHFISLGLTRSHLFLGKREHLPRAKGKSEKGTCFFFPFLSPRHPVLTTHTGRPYALTTQSRTICWLSSQPPISDATK